MAFLSLARGELVYHASMPVLRASLSNQTCGLKLATTYSHTSYDGDGKRIKKFIPSIGELTIFVYDAVGKIVAEYSTQVSQDPKVSYTTADHLGSPRILTDENGATISRRDFHPFGEEVFTAERIAALGYQGDDVRQKFTGYERDEETGLDYAKNRYHSPAHGRFQSPDPILISIQRLINPQGWNSYSYAGNNPLKFVDPLGLEKIQLNDTEEQIKKKKEAEKLKKEALIAEKNALRKNKASKDEIKAKQKEIDAVNNTMSAMDRKMAATRVVQGLLDALDEVGERNGLELSDFTVSTDPNNDYKNDTAILSKLKGSEAIAVTDAAGAKMIIINGGLSTAFYSQITNFTDPNRGLFVYKGAAIARHEQRHTQGGNENAAYTTERMVFNKFRPKFMPDNLPLYDALDKVIADGIANNP